MIWRAAIVVFVGSLAGMLLAAPLIDWSHSSPWILLITPTASAAVVVLIELVKARRRRGS
jgi:hypothetical protein